MLPSQRIFAERERHIMLFLGFVAFIGLFSHPSEAGIWDGAPSYDVPQLKSIDVDGRANDWAQKGMKVHLLTGTIGRLIPADDLHATVRLGWDADGLLVLLRIRDDRYDEADRSDRLWSGDSVELHLAPERGAGDAFKVVLSPGMGTDHDKLRRQLYDHRRPATKNESGSLQVEAARSRSDGAVTLEVRLPWTNLGIQPEETGQAAFQVVVNDRDGPDSDPDRLTWFPWRGANRDTDRMHSLRLSGNAGPPVRAAARTHLSSSGGLRVDVVAEQPLAGKEITLSARDQTLARGTLQDDRGRSAVALSVSRPLPVGTTSMVVSVAGTRIAHAPTPLIESPSPPEHPEQLGARISRTMSLMETSNSRRRHEVRILFYGQSIVAGSWTDLLAQELRTRFPDVEFTIEDRSLGGYQAPLLARTAEYDVYPFAPDLIVFHVYSGTQSGDLERIFRNLRRRTTAEIMALTHHAPLPNGGFDASSDVWRHLAQKYNCELVDVRKGWKKYCSGRDLSPKDLLSDSVHPNVKGEALMAALVGRHFQFNPRSPSGWTDRIRTYEARAPLEHERDTRITFTGENWSSAPNRGKGGGRKKAFVVGRTPDSALTCSFNGNRIDVIPGAFSGDTGSARVLVDGKPLPEHNRLYTFTRPDRIPGAPWPGLRRIAHETPIRPETWTLRITEVSRDPLRYTYRVRGSKTGPDGTGNNRETFTSDSGRVVIEPRDLSFEHAEQYSSAEIEPGLSVSWTVEPQFTFPYAPSPSEDGSRVRRITLVRGLKNGRHTLKIVPRGDGPVPVESIVVHQPPLR